MTECGAPGAVVTAVDEGAAALAGLRVGDVVCAVDGAPVRDIIDWWWLTEESAFELTVERDGERLALAVEREAGEPLGVGFGEVVFDGVRECENACQFCFVSQLPAGLRPALYVRDDDYRLSFLIGNFVTFTNVADADVARIVEQRLSPLHVSIHAVDPNVRSRLICPTAEDRALEIVDTLLAAEIEMHVQIVLVPGINDGDVLGETVAWLSERPGIASVGVVPIGFTAHQSRWQASFTPAQAAEVVAGLAPWQTRARAERGTGWVYAADEFYLTSGAESPPASDYDDFPQFENGIGMVRSFLDEFGPAPGSVRQVTLVTGTLFAPVLRAALESGRWSGVRTLAVENRLFGGNVSVTGLLCGQDIIDAIASDGAKGTYLVPDVVVNSDGLLLDDVPANRLAERAGCDVRIIGRDGAGLMAALTGSESQAHK